MDMRSAKRPPAFLSAQASTRGIWRAALAHGSLQARRWPPSDQSWVCRHRLIPSQVGFALNDPDLAVVADIVRAADTGHPEHVPQAAGLLAVSLGLSAMYADDLQMLEAGMLVYDALYAWAKSARGEIHNAALFEPKSQLS
jgi:Chromate resistance exported protein